MCRRAQAEHCLLQAETLDEAVSIVNANEHGNGTALFTRSGPAARKFQNEVDVGMVSSSALLCVRTAYHPPMHSHKRTASGPTNC